MPVYVWVVLVVVIAASMALCASGEREEARCKAKGGVYLSQEGVCIQRGATS